MNLRMIGYSWCHGFCPAFWRRLCIVLLITLLKQGQCAPPNQMNANDERAPVGVGSPGTGFDISYVGTLLGVALLVSLILVASLCSAGCWPLNKVFRNREPDFPGGEFTNPIANSSGGLSQIDVTALELDPVVFEPLPTLRNLSPRGERFQAAFEPHGNSSTLFGPAVPFTSDEANIYAHDWFDEPYKNFSRGNLEYFKILGKAWFGQVIDAEAQDIVPYAKKIRVTVKELREDASGLEQMRFLDESRLYRESCHGNILKLLGHSIEMSPFLLIMESFPQGNLKSFLIANVTRAEILNARGDVLHMALDIARGLEWMASNFFTHSDLAARNCQVGSEGRIVIGDYGLATQMFKDDYYWSSNNSAIPLRWSAPEILYCTANSIQSRKVTTVSNVWTYGICLWEVCEFGKLPYFEFNDEEIITRVILEKNYILGQPTMPSLSMRENLCDIMKACWNFACDERPSMSEVVSALEIALRDLKPSQHMKNEFDSKWEQLAAGSVSISTSSKSPIEAGKRKSVSFFEMSPMLLKNGETRILSQTASPISNLSDPINWTSDKCAQKLSNDIVLPKFSDPEEELWRTKLERGEISQKVREKSQSVQDLMILTHVEPSDLGEPDSIGLIQKPQGTFQATPGSSGHPSPILRKSSSETALSPNWRSPSPSSQPTGIPRIALSASSDTKTVATPQNLSAVAINVIGPTPSPGVAINVINPTPSPGVAINVIGPTPSPCAAITQPISSPTAPDHDENVAVVPSTVEQIKRRYKFIFDDKDFGESSEMQRDRLTSTPLRTPTSPVMESKDSEVFDSPAGIRAGISENLDESCTISPIPKTSSATKSNQLAKSNYSILMGASDDLGLEPYQALTTEMSDCIYGTSEEPTEHSSKSSSGGLSSGSKALERNLSDTRSQVPESPDQAQCPNKKEDSFCKRLNSNFVPRKLCFEADGQITPSSLQCGSSVLNKLSTKSPLQPQSITSEDDDFWSKQMNSLKEATGNTLALFQLGLGPEDDPAKRKSEGAKANFIEDIEAANEESDSLIFHDFDNENYTQTKIGREASPFVEPDNSAPLTLDGMAFGGSIKEGKRFPAKGERSKHEKEVTKISKLNPNNSIEVIKKAGKLGSTKNSDEEDKESTESECEAEFPEFVPSMWNQNLTPAKPAIKSPEMLDSQEASEPPSQVIKRAAGMKKSVSFERKKTQLVYEYPPQVASDSDEEETKHKRHEFGGPLALALDWELQPDELEEAPFNNEDWEDDDDRPKWASKAHDVYRISGVEDNFQIKTSSQPFVFTSLPTPPRQSACAVGLGSQPAASASASPSSLGELRHTRDKLKLDLSRGEASLLEENSKNPRKLDSGVGSSTSTNISPFSHCDN